MDTLADMMGVQVVESSPDKYVLNTPVTAAMLQPHGVLHGGISAYLAEHAASECTTRYNDNSKSHALGVDLVSTHLAPIMEGDVIETVATPIRDNVGRVRFWRINQFRKSDGVMFNTSQLTMYMKKANCHTEGMLPPGCDAWRLRSRHAEERGLAWQPATHARTTSPRAPGSA